MQIITYSERRLVKRHRGTMPVILTCPHDGSESPPNVSERTSDRTPAGCGRFETGGDPHTAEITESVAQEVLERTGLSPYVVIARFRRRFIDANRSENCAFTDPDAESFYDEYHSRIDGYVNQILAQNQGRGFLFDIHGTGVKDDDPADIYLGTRNGRTLLAEFDRENIFMQHGLHGLLKWVRRQRPAPYGPPEVYGYNIQPADAAGTERLNGQFTVVNYGAKINSIQIEVASTIRNDDQKRAFFVEDLAFAIVNFVRRHAPF